MKRIVYLILGFICTILGVLGVLLPVMPGVIFFVAGAYFFSHSSKKMQHFLYRLPFVGESILEWDMSRSLNRKAKKAVMGLSFGMAIYPYWLNNKAYAIIMTNFFFVCSFCVYAIQERPAEDSSGPEIS